MPVRTDDTLEEILDLFHKEGNLTTGYFVDATGLSRPTVSKRLDRLYAADCIEYLHEPTALWKLRKDPRENGK